LANSARPVARPVGVMWVSSTRLSGQAANKASTSGSTARVSPTDTACTMKVMRAGATAS
jgi:hypothetical protein